MNRFRSLATRTAIPALAVLALGLSTPARADILVGLTTDNGIVPGTGITYTITDSDAGNARNIWPATGNTDNDTWNWTTGFPEFLTIGGTQTMEVDFSAPVPINQIVLGVNSTLETTSTLTVSGGTATTSDFDLSDGLAVLTGGLARLATYDGSTGIITSPIGAGDVALMIGSTSTNTITSFTLVTPESGGGSDGYTQFFGLTVPAADTPEPGVLGLLLSTGVVGIGVLRRRRSRR